MADILLQTAANTDSAVGAVFAFVVSLLIGTVAIRFGARIVVDRDTGYRRAAVTALAGAIVWSVFAYFLGWVPLLGPLLTLAAWVGIINWQYEGGWATAVGIGLVAWLVALFVLYLLGAVGVVSFQALGIPGA